jgi:gluconate 5-dehydrogenase
VSPPFHSRFPALFSLAGKVALVTGSTRGLGLEIALALAQAGASVCINGRDPKRLSEAASRFAPENLVRQMCFDVADADARGQALDAVVKEHGKLDIVVGNVGQRNRKPVVEFSDLEIASLINIDLIASIGLARDAAKLMIPNRSGCLIWLSSVAGYIGTPNDAVYNSAKQGLTGMMRGLASELGPHGIRCNAIAPGPFATETNAGMVADQVASERMKAKSALGRWGEAWEIGGAAVFLASSAASYITGHLLFVDGGQSHAPR